MKQFLTALLILLLVASPTSIAFAQDEEDGRPGDGLPLAKAHPSWKVEQVRPADWEPQVGALAWSPDGKYLAVLTFNPRRTGASGDYNGQLQILENATSKDTAKVKKTLVSEELILPLGAYWLEEGLFVLERHELSKWTDKDGDGIPETKETHASGWISVNFHDFSFGLGYHDGYLYGALSTSLHMNQEERDSAKANPDDPIAGQLGGGKGKTRGGNAPCHEFRGCVMKISVETGEIEWIAGGLRTPNGVGTGPGGIVLAPDNQGDFKPSNGIYVAKNGEFFGKYNATFSHDNLPDGGVPSMYSDKEPTPPAIWLPQNEVGNSPSATLLIPDDKPFAGQVLSADLTQGAIHRIFMEEVDGTWQGAAFRHTMGLEGGPNDIKWGPDGALYVGAMGSGGSGGWGWGKTLFGLQRLAPTGKTAFEYEKIEATKDGFRVTFTEPVKAGQLEKLDNWQVTAWTYVATPFYGGPKREEHKANVTGVKVADDRKSAELIVDGRRANYVYHIRIDATSEKGEQMWSPESWVTFHKAPK
jgi:hypothetical protein